MLIDWGTTDVGYSRGWQLVALGVIDLGISGVPDLVRIIAVVVSDYVEQNITATDQITQPLKAGEFITQTITVEDSV